MTASLHYYMYIVHQGCRSIFRIGGGGGGGGGEYKENFKIFGAFRAQSRKIKKYVYV